jgi:C_GCAxxG_C_C family probable redox protein
MTDFSVLAESTFSRGFNCAQAVFSTFAKHYGLDEQTALKISAAFGAGMARRGDTCGAVTGALMALGLARLGTQAEDKERNYQLAQEFMRSFSGKHGSLLCRELIGCDLGTPDGRQQAQDSGITKTLCPMLVREAVEILQHLLEAE